jgi:hypothetical protein
MKKQVRLLSPILQSESGNQFICKGIAEKLVTIPSYLKVLKAKYAKMGLRLVGLRDESEIHTLKNSSIQDHTKNIGGHVPRFILRDSP